MAIAWVLGILVPVVVYGQMTTTMFYNDQWLSTRINASFAQNDLVFAGEFHDNYSFTGWGFPQVFDMGVDSVNDGLPRYRMIYDGFIEVGGDLAKFLQLLVSDDGVHWDPWSNPTPLPHPAPPNALIALGTLEMGGALDDSNAVQNNRPDLRFKILLTNTSVLASSDCVHWNVIPGLVWKSDDSDPRDTIAFDDVANEYVFLERASRGDRRIFKSVVGKEWGLGNSSLVPPDPILQFEADPLDEELTQLYGLPVFPQDGNWVGFLWLYHTLQSGEGKYLGGTIAAELCFGPSPQSMMRNSRIPLLPPPPYNSLLRDGMFYPTSVLSTSNNDTLVFASTSKSPHGVVAPSNGSILILRSPFSRWIGLSASSDSPALLVTRPLQWNSGTLYLNGDLSNALVEVRDTADSPIAGYSFQESIPITGNSKNLQPSWTSHKTLDQLKGQKIAIAIQLPPQSSLFSITGNFTREIY